jgi:plasmid stabilization system protein ParE
VRAGHSQDCHSSLMALTPEAQRHVRALYAYYEERDRPEAARALRNALTATRRPDRS